MDVVVFGVNAAPWEAGHCSMYLLQYVVTMRTDLGTPFFGAFFTVLMTYCGESFFCIVVIKAVGKLWAVASQAEGLCFQSGL